MNKGIEKAIKETLVVENKQSIRRAVDKILRLINSGLSLYKVCYKDNANSAAVTESIHLTEKGAEMELAWRREQDVKEHYDLYDGDPPFPYPGKWFVEESTLKE
ncbi:MAG: hypothetical protein ACLFUH_07645 [Bacteroidales bacterium]